MANYTPFGVGEALNKSTLEDRLDELDSAVAAIYQTDAEQSISSSTTAVVDYEDSVVDTHSAVTTGASWVFTVPAGLGGLYLVTGCITYAAIDPQTGELYYVRVEVDAFTVGYLFYNDGLTSGGSQAWGMGGSLPINVVAGGEIRIRVRQESGGAEALTTAATQNQIGIFRVGATT